MSDGYRTMTDTAFIIEGSRRAAGADRRAGSLVDELWQVVTLEAPAFRGRAERAFGVSVAHVPPMSPAER